MAWTKQDHANMAIALLAKADQAEAADQAVIAEAIHTLIDRHRDLAT